MQAAEIRDLDDDTVIARLRLPNVGRVLVEREALAPDATDQALCDQILPATWGGRDPSPAPDVGRNLPVWGTYKHIGHRRALT
jgi:hypothetical protein